MKVTKLDVYDCMILPGVIRIRIDGTNDPDVADIMSEIDRSKGNIHIDGLYYSYLNNYRLFSQGSEAFIELDVVEVA